MGFLDLLDPSNAQNFFGRLYILSEYQRSDHVAR
jgi:hypothetical protein